MGFCCEYREIHRAQTWLGGLIYRKRVLRIEMRAQPIARY